MDNNARCFKAKQILKNNFSEYNALQKFPGPNIQTLCPGLLFLAGRRTKQHLFQSGRKNVLECTPSSAATRPPHVNHSSGGHQFILCHLSSFITLLIISAGANRREPVDDMCVVVEGTWRTAGDGGVNSGGNTCQSHFLLKLSV